MTRYVEILPILMKMSRRQTKAFLNTCRIIEDAHQRPISNDEGVNLAKASIRASR